MTLYLSKTVQENLVEINLVGQSARQLQILFFLVVFQCSAPACFQSNSKTTANYSYTFYCSEGNW